MTKRISMAIQKRTIEIPENVKLSPRSIAYFSAIREMFKPRAAVVLDFFEIILVKYKNYT